MHIVPQNTFLKIGLESIREALLQRIHTEEGRAVLSDWKPAVLFDTVKLRLDRTREFIDIHISDETVPLQPIPDLRPDLQASRIERKILDTEIILAIRNLCILSRRIQQFFKQRSELYPLSFDIARHLSLNPDLEKEINRILTEEGEVKDTASRALRDIRNNLNRRRNEVRSVLNRMLRKLSGDGSTADEGLTLRGGRLVLPVKAEFKRKIPGLIHDVSATGQTVYLEPSEAVEINNDIRQLEIAEQKEIALILRNLTSSIGKVSEELEYNLSLIGEIDALNAMAAFSMSYDGQVPQITKGRKLRLLNTRNPLLILKSQKGAGLKKEDIIPLSLELDRDEQALIITGPNAGGKSVALKTIGLCVLMAQFGLAIPASPDCELPVVDGLFFDVGDDQSIENDLSTFTSHVTWMEKVLREVTENSLVLIDEAGSSTDPEEGGALYRSFIEEIIDKKARIIVTTHHGSLKAFAHNHPRVVNGSMEFDQEHLSPTYRFRKGIPGSSYAFEIAERMGLPHDLTSRARGYLGEQRTELESLILSMEHSVQQSDEKVHQLEKERRELQKQRKFYQDKYEALKREQDRIREKALNEARDVIVGANKRIEEAVEKIRTEKASRKSIKSAHSEVEEEKKRIDAELERIEEEEETPKDMGEPPIKGDMIRLKDSKSTGELVETDGKNAVVLVNGMRLRTKYKNLIKVEKPAKKKKDPVRVIMDDSGGGGFRPHSTRLDLRGFRGEEAVKEVAHFIDEAVVSGLTSLEIIHGKGEGILRKLIHEYLRKRPEVKNFELAPWEQGGPGCTLVTLG